MRRFRNGGLWIAALSVVAIAMTGCARDSVAEAGEQVEAEAELPAEIATEAPALGFGTQTIAVSQGTTLMVLAKHHATTVRDLLELNPALGRETFIRPGQTVVLPEPQVRGDEGRPQVQFEMLIAKVPVGYPLTDESMAVPVLESRADTKILTTPSIFPVTGEAVTFAHGSDAGTSVTVVPTVRRQAVDYELLIMTWKPEPGGGTRTTHIETHERAFMSVLKCHELGPARGGGRDVIALRPDTPADTTPEILVF